MMLNRDIKFSEIHDVFLDRTLSVDRVSDEPMSTAFRQVAWSSPGLLPGKKCILASVSADHRVVLYRNGKWAWEEIDHPYQALAEYLRTNVWANETVDQREDEHSVIFSRHKSRAYQLGTIAIGWSPVFNSLKKWAWFITLQRSGHLVIWKAEAPFEKLAFVALHDLKVQDPSVLKIHPGAQDNEILIFVGTSKGLLKCWIISQLNNEAPSCNFLGSIVEEEDYMVVGSVEVFSSCNYLIVSTVKNNSLLFHSVRIDAGGIHIVNENFVTLPSLQISGTTKLNNGNMICVTEDYIFNEIDLSINNDGIFQGLAVRKLNISSNQSMLCRGIANCYPNDGNVFFVLESVKVIFDHLKCRHPTSLLVYVNANPDKVMKTLESTTCLSQSLMALETYKVLNCANWETIWELDLEGAETEDDCYLQLLRWFALLKLNACFVERRYDKDCHEALKSRAEKAALILSLRHMQRQQAKCLNRSEEDLYEKDLTFIRLSCQFLDSTEVKESNIAIDRVLVEKLKNQFKLDYQSFQEKCSVCGCSIPFVTCQEGKCEKGHRAPRCSATLRCCFGKTLQCKWCGVHYHPDTEITSCILCDGSIQL